VKVLLLSAYAAHSHVYWERSLRAMFPHWQWQVLSLPPRHFSWRVRGNPLYWALAERERLQQDYDLLVATSMVDLATLRGLVPALARLPTLLYFHENQFDYPQRSYQPSLLEAQMVSLYSALAADHLAFNSAYNRDSFLAGVNALLGKLPDRVPEGVAGLLADKARVLPVAIDPVIGATVVAHWPGTAGSYPQRPLRLLWSGRFEHDKGGETLWHTLVELERIGLRYELALTGQQFRRSPTVFGRIEAEFAHRLVHFGYMPLETDYRALLRGADVVLSTAQHEFQGLAVLEAVAAGCLPAVPDRQAYPEIYPARFRYSAYPDDAAREGAAAAALVHDLAGVVGGGAGTPPDVSGFGLARLQPRYRELLLGLAG
jgi:glycosyltransferase involved in cell wall biosynthesis